MRYVSAVVGLLFGFIVVGPGQEVAAQSVPYSAWIAGCKTYPELCVPRCQRDALYCANQIKGYLLMEVRYYRFFLVKSVKNQTISFQDWKNSECSEVAITKLSDSMVRNGNYTI